MADKRRLQRGRIGRRLTLKIRVRPLVRMPKSELFHQVRHAIRTGVVPDTVEIMAMDWGHATGRRLQAGSTISGDDLDAMRDFYNVLTAMDSGDLRFERAD